MPLSRATRFRLSLFALLLVATAGLWADEPFSGWRQVKTEHFTFIFEPRDSQAVTELLTFCEDVYRKVTTLYDSYPSNIPCIVRGRIDSANGAFIPFPDRLELYVASPSWPWMSRKNEDWLRTLLTHELTHYVQLTYNTGFMATLSSIFGFDLRAADAALLPDWLIEGPAVFAETFFTKGGRGRDAFFKMLYEAPILDGSFFSYQKAGFFSPYPPAGRPYVAGYLLSNYLSSLYGLGALQSIQKRFVRWPLFGPEAAIKAVTGQTGKAIFGKMVKTLKKDLDADARRPSGTLVTPSRYGNWFLPVITARGWVVYRSTLDSAPALVFYDPENRSERVIVKTALTDPSSYTADRSGTIVVYAALESTTDMAGPVETSDLYLAETKSGRVRRLTHGAHLLQPALSPDGSTLVAVKRSGSYSYLVSVDMRSGDEHVLFRKPQVKVYNPSFSPDGRSIVFTMNDRGVQDIWLLRYPVASTAGSGEAQKTGAANENLPRLITGPDVDGEYFPGFDGQSVIFGSDRGGHLSVYRQSLADGRRTLIADDPVGAYAARVIGDKVLYATYTSRGYALKIAPLLHTPVPSEPASHGATPQLQFPVASVTPREDTGTSLAHAAGSPGTIGARDGTPSLLPGDLATTSTRYVDLPRFLYWAPLPIYYDPESPETVALGAGVILSGASLLGNVAWQAIVTDRLDVFQPGIDLSLTTGIGPVSAQLALTHSFEQTISGTYTQKTRESLSGRWSILSKSRSPGFVDLSVSAGVEHDTLAGSTAPFSIVDGFSSPSIPRGQAIGLDAGMSFDAGMTGAVRDLYAPLDFRTDASTFVPVFTSGSVASGLTLSSTTTFQFPSLIPHQVIRTGLKIGYADPVLSGYRGIEDRGGFVPKASETPGRWLLALDYLFPITLADLPLPLGLHLFQVGGGVHVETEGGWGTQAGGVTWDRYIYPGAEVVFLIGRGSYLPVGIGVNFRIDVDSPGSFTAASDIRPYLYVGLDSLRNVLATRSGCEVKQ